MMLTDKDDGVAFEVEPESFQKWTSAWTSLREDSFSSVERTGNAEVVSLASLLIQLVQGPGEVQQLTEACNALFLQIYKASEVRNLKLQSEYAENFTSVFLNCACFLPVEQVSTSTVRKQKVCGLPTITVQKRAQRFGIKFAINMQTFSCRMCVRFVIQKRDVRSRSRRQPPARVILPSALDTRAHHNIVCPDQVLNPPLTPVVIHLSSITSTSSPDFFRHKTFSFSKSPVCFPIDVRTHLRNVKREFSM